LYRGIIFDFNGTLFHDSELHEEAWDFVSRELRGKDLTREEMNEHVLGRNNSYIIGFLLGRRLDYYTYTEIRDRKEDIYRRLCLERRLSFHLAPGVEEFLDKLKEREIPLAIATASNLDNVEFYIEHLKLDKWFKIGNIIYDDGTFQGKPAPDIYLRAAKALDLKPGECVVFEDAPAGIKSACNAGVLKVIVVGNKKELINNQFSDNHLSDDKLLSNFLKANFSLPYNVDLSFIKDFSEIDLETILKK